MGSIPSITPKRVLPTLANHVGYIIRERALKKVVRVATGAIVTFVKHAQLGVNASMVKSISNPVSQILNPLIANSTVSGALKLLLPRPTLVDCANGYLSPEPFLFRWKFTPFRDRTHGAPLNPVLFGNHAKTITQSLLYG